MIILLTVGIVAVAAFFIASDLREKHKKQVQKERTCTCPEGPDSTRICGAPTKRYCQMIDLTKSGEASRLGALHQWHVFDKCDRGHTQQIKHGSKWFSWYKLLWRRFTDPEQFVRNESLFADAELIDKTVLSLPERIKLFDAVRRNRAVRLVLPTTEKLVELSPVRHKSVAVTVFVQSSAGNPNSSRLSTPTTASSNEK